MPKYFAIKQWPSSCTKIMIPNTSANDAIVQLKEFSISKRSCPFESDYSTDEYVSAMLHSTVFGRVLRRRRTKPDTCAGHGLQVERCRGLTTKAPRNFSLRSTCFGSLNFELTLNFERRVPELFQVCRGVHPARVSRSISSSLSRF
jgi:hypothetical protein